MTAAASGRALADEALATVGLHDGVELLAEGMSSSAWRGSIDGTTYVVRVPKNDGRRPLPRYRAEARLLADLHRRGVPVAAPTIVEIAGAECSIALEVPGQPVRPTDWTPRLLAEVATALDRVHETTPELAVEGDVRRRFHLARIWPFDGTDLADHPVALRWPELQAPIASREADILAAGSAPPTVVHTDLHWDHLLVDDGRLSAILDFGDAFAGPPGWDHACLRYYHGPQVARTPHDGDRLLGIAFALYKLAKTPDRADVVERVESMLRDAIR